jgi:tetratricopeptide (TPR) repeat protein
MDTSLHKKVEWIYAGNFHNTARNIKFAELFDTSKTNMVDEAIGILSCSDFYHYTDSISVSIESLHNFETDQSVIFNLADSLVYFAVYPHFAAWSKWLKFNYITHEVSLYKDVDPKLNRPDVLMNTELMKQLESCDWRDTSEIRRLVNGVIASHIENYYILNLLTTTFLDRYKMPGRAMIYSEKFIKKYPDVASGYYNKGLINKALNQNELAIEEFQKALECVINCEYYQALAYEQLALTYSKIGNEGKAKKNAVKALEIHDQYWIPEWMNQRIEQLKEIAGK